MEPNQLRIESEGLKGFKFPDSLFCSGRVIGSSYVILFEYRIFLSGIARGIEYSRGNRAGLVAALALQ
jgi:hypothetical protein